jgi:hypothetical protein
MLACAGTVTHNKPSHTFQGRDTNMLDRLALMYNCPEVMINGRQESRRTWQNPPERARGSTTVNSSWGSGSDACGYRLGTTALGFLRLLNCNRIYRWRYYAGVSPQVRERAHGLHLHDITNAWYHGHSRCCVESVKQLDGSSAIDS